MEAASVHHLQAVPDGEVPADGPQTMAEALHHIRLLEGELERVTDELEGETRARRAAKGEATRYRRLLEGKRREDDQAADISDVLEHWRGLCMPGAEIVEADDRWEKVKARMNDKIKGRTGGFTVEELKLAVDGALLDPFYHGENDRRTKYMDCTTFFKGARQVQKHIARARKELDRQLDERLAAFFAEHPSLVYDAIVRERQVESLKVLAPCAFEPKPSEVKRLKQTQADWLPEHHGPVPEDPEDEWREYPE